MENRIRKTRLLLKKDKLDSLLISSSYNISYLTGFAGFDVIERGGYALLTRSKLYLFANSLYATEAKNNSFPGLTSGVSIPEESCFLASIPPRLESRGFLEVSNEAKNTEVIELSSGVKLIPSLQKIIDAEKIKVLGFEENLTYSEHKTFKKLKGIKLKLANEIIEQVRIIKDETELESLKKACKLTDDTFDHVIKFIRVGVTELELAWEIEKYIKENGGELAFPSIVAFGKNSATPHHKASSQKLEASSIVLMDFGARVNGYCADMTRTIFFGRANEKFKKIYEAVRRGQELSLRAKRSNLSAENVDKLARDYIESQGYPSIPHSVGHGVGLEVHELPHISPGSKNVIETNTAFTIEPGIYLPNIGGVRIEDTAYFDGKRIISFTKSLKSLIEL